MTEQPENLRLDATIIGVRQQDGKNYVIYADGATREVESWKAGWEALKRGEIERNLLGIRL